MRGWMKDERQMICCCSDGTRPVIFKIDRLDYQRVSIKGMGCENCEKKIRAAFEALPGVKEVTASHEIGVAEVFLEAGVPEKTKGMYEKGPLRHRRLRSHRSRRIIIYKVREELRDER